MSEVLRQYQALIDHEITLVLSGLVFVFGFQLVVFRWAERSSLVTATYFLTTGALVGGPLLAAVIGTPNRLFNIYDREVTWTLLAYLMTIIGIACSGAPHHGSTSTRIRRPRRFGRMRPQAA